MRGAICGVLVVIVVGCEQGGDEVARRLESLPPTPAELRTGEQLYDRNCASCHGAKARGTDKGPPLAHRIYEPNHHSDQAFYLAARNGVAAHHWRFGNMPARPGVSQSDVAAIVAYVRWIQRETGLY